MANKIEFDITKDRDAKIKAMDLKNVDKEYIFFYDETNNIRKLYLKDEESFNVPIEDVHKHFVLGGVVYENRNIEINLEQLIGDMRINNNARELKFKHIAKGNFLDCLKSRRLNIFLDWLIDNKFYIHYSDLDIFYWSIVDILDSAVDYYPYFHYDDLNFFKMLLYEIVKKDIKKIVEILYKYHYPNIEEAFRTKFLKEIIEFIGRYKTSVINDFSCLLNDVEVEIDILIDIFRYAMGKELVFIEKNITRKLIDEFALFYQQPIELFTKSQHIFDEEKQVMEFFEKFIFMDRKTILNNFKFVKSDEYELIQVSDIIVGLLGKFMTYIDQLKFNQINFLKINLDSMQKENIGKFLYLLKQSIIESNAFFHYITSISHINKIGLLLNEF